MRMMGWLVLVVGLGCTLDTGGLGSAVSGREDTQAGPGSTTTGGTTAATTGVDATEGTVGGNEGTATGVVSSTGPSATEGQDTTVGSTTGSELVEDGLLARWYVDDANQGRTTKSLMDSEAPAVDLDMMYVSDQPTHVETDGNRGLSWPNIQLYGRAQAPIVGTKLYDELGQASQATFELVLAVQETTQWTSRFLFIGTDASDDFSIGADGTDRLEVRWRGRSTRYFAASLSGARQVLHVVVDTELADAETNDRTRAYLDGVELMPSDGHVPNENERLPLRNTSSVVLGNRANGDRSFHGQLYYAAIYLGALGPDDVQTNATALLIDDDRP